MRSIVWPSTLEWLRGLFGRTFAEGSGRQARHRDLFEDVLNTRLNDYYIDNYPSAEAGLALFTNTWSSHIPVAGKVTGNLPLFADGRLSWLFDQIGGIDGWNVLELGPLEAAHTSMLHAKGAASITAIEANAICYLKCLVIKEIFHLDRARFSLGNFERFLSDTSDRFDLIVASGVLYHLMDPLLALLDMMRVTDRIFVWSHFFNDAAMPITDARRSLFTRETIEREHSGAHLTYHVRSYGGMSHSGAFCGGIHESSVWLELPQVTELLEQNGYRLTLGFEHPDHANGPAACFVAVR
jgi:hypothetical protein